MRPDEVLIRREEVVRIHLDRLEQLLSSPRPGVAEAIQASLSLRFLLDGALNHAARNAGQTLMIPAPDIGGVPIKEALLFACGGYVLAGQVVAPYYGYRASGQSSPHRKHFEHQLAMSPQTLVMKEYKLGAFLNLPCLALMGELVSREATVRYVANKCGGAHHADDLATFDHLDRRLTSVGHILRLNGDGVSAVFLETLGTAWFLLNAPSLGELRTTLSSNIHSDNKVEVRHQPE